MKDKISAVVLDEKPIGKRIGSEKEIRKMIELSAYAIRSKKDGYFIESFIVAYQLMQDIFLPDLRRLVLHKIGLDKLENKFADENSPYNINLEYVALSHDIELFNLLEKARKARNEIVHSIVKDDTLGLSQNRAKEGLKSVLDSTKAIIDRLQGIKAIPVLTLYAKGWNDYRSQAIKILKES